MEIPIVQRWSKFGDTSWGFLEEGRFYPIHTSKSYVETARINLERFHEYHVGYLKADGWYEDQGHFIFPAHPFEIDKQQKEALEWASKHLQPVLKDNTGRMFREDDE